MHQCWCHRCQKSFYESFPFLSSPKARITKALEQLILKLRAEMSIKGIAEHFNISWDTVKDVEKRFLADKYRHVPLGKVRGITVDEMKVFNRGRPSRKFITIVRDAETGDVLSVSRGKGADALKMFSSRIRRSGAKIRYVCMDMSKAYTAWAKETIPQAEIVYDRFHLMKMMNERLDGVRRRVARKLDEDAAKDLKGKRFVLLRNEDDLDSKGAADLERIREINSDLADAHMLKERLRAIYATAKNGFDAYCLLRGWCAAADATGVARTRSHGEDHPQPHQGHPRLLEAGRRDKRLHGGLQRQGALAHQAGLRVQGLQVLPAQDIRPPVNRHPQAALGGSHE